MSQPLPGDQADEHAFLDSVEGEISFFRSIMRARPVGMHRHFHILTVRNAIHKDTGRTVQIDTIWEKLRKCYDLDALDAIDLDADGYSSPHTNGGGLKSKTTTIRSPSPSENLSCHPFFREEFSLPYDEFEPIIAQRRLRATVSLPSSPAASPGVTTGFGNAENGSAEQRRTSTPDTHLLHHHPHLNTSGATGSASSSSASASANTGPKRHNAGTSTSASASVSAARGTKRGKAGSSTAKSKLNLAGLVGGDSDSSALTQESEGEGDGFADKGDASASVAGGGVGTPRERESVVTGTDGGTEYGEDEDVEMKDAETPAEVSSSAKPARGRGRKGPRGTGAGTTRGTGTRGKKRTKR